MSDPHVRELPRSHDVEHVDLPTGRGPQLTRAPELGTATTVLRRS